MNRFLENQKTGHDYQCDDAWRGLTNGEIFMKKNTYKFSVDVVFAYNIFSTDTQKNLNFTVTTDICRDNFSDAVAAFKTYVRYITHDMIELSIPDLVEKRVEGILSIIRGKLIMIPFSRANALLPTSNGIPTARK